MSLVWEFYPIGGGELLTALAYADHAHDDGTGIRPSVSHVARKTRQSERTVQRYLASMRQKKWLLTVRNGDGGRGYATEYRINPLWITNPDNLSPFPNTDQKRVSPEVKKGDNGGSKRVTPVSPQPSRTIIEPTTTQSPAVTEGLEDVVVGCVDDLVWPALLCGKAKESAIKIIQECPSEKQQLVLDEITGLSYSGTVRNPIGLLHKLVDLAKQGKFVPSAALKYQQKLENEAKASQSRRDEKKRRQESTSTQARENAKGHLAEIRKKVKI